MKKSRVATRQQTGRRFDFSNFREERRGVRLEEQLWRISLRNRLQLLRSQLLCNRQRLLHTVDEEPGDTHLIAGVVRNLWDKASNLQPGRGLVKPLVRGFLEGSMGREHECDGRACGEVRI